MTVGEIAHNAKMSKHYADFHVNLSLCFIGFLTNFADSPMFFFLEIFNINAKDIQKNSEFILV